MSEKCFASYLNGLDEKEYLINMLTFNISPTIYGLKPSTLITLSDKNKNLYTSWMKYGEEFLENLSINVLKLKQGEDYCVLLFYDKILLEKSIRNEKVQRFLSTLGYEVKENLQNILQYLSFRYNIYNCPHEIGIFLGIPIEDVETFINCKDKECLACGYWKVYHNKELALKTFNTYDASKQHTATLLMQGMDLGSICSTIKI